MTCFRLLLKSPSWQSVLMLVRGAAADSAPTVPDSGPVASYAVASDPFDLPPTLAPSDGVQGGTVIINGYAWGG
jgi:hypothetical protein